MKSDCWRSATSSGRKPSDIFPESSGVSDAKKRSTSSSATPKTPAPETDSTRRAPTGCCGGCDVLTGGNHIFRKKEIRHYLDESEIVVRPANYPYGTPGNGYTIFGVNGFNILIINLLGTIYMESLACPFMTADRILEREKGRYDLAVLDFHAEATSEKIALGRYLDGRISAVWGTHTHVATADNQVLPKGSGYVTDLGMSGPPDGVLGIRADIIIEKLRTKLPVKFEFAEGATEVNGVIFALDTDSGKCVSTERVKF